jgi:DNA-binding PadR family transcriptional regulator
MARVTLATDTLPIYRRHINDRTEVEVMRDFREMHEARLRAFGGWRPPFPPPGHGHGHGGRGRGRGRSGRRGNVRAAILALLTERPMHGYEMIKEIDSRTGGVWSPSPGSIYPTLQLLEDEGLIVSEENEGRKRFSLTEAGQTEATAAAADPPWNEFSAETVSNGQDSREAIFGIMNALRQLGFEGDREQWHKAIEVLAETKRKLYAILADSE